MNICKQVAGNLVHALGNVPRRDVIPKFSDLEIVTLNMTSEAIGLDRMYDYGYKHHAVCGLSGVIPSFDLTKASVYDISLLKEVKLDYSNCTFIGDRGYISTQVLLDLFETANIRLEVPYRFNQKNWKRTFPAFAKA